MLLIPVITIVVISFMFCYLTGKGNSSKKGVKKVTPSRQEAVLDLKEKRELNRKKNALVTSFKVGELVYNEYEGLVEKIVAFQYDEDAGISTNRDFYGYPCSNLSKLTKQELALLSENWHIPIR